ncbi:MAG: substrate-binding domain-containing protein, partial [Polynucleobacter sp.]|nr:substrate-binding domain-containing protein [Polynucleobacter sp.]
SLTLAITTAAPSNAGTWCSVVKISYFKGGNSDSFSDILEKGARQAAADTGANVTIISSNWDFPLMVQKFKEEIAKKPDAISFMGHPGDAAIMPTVKSAKDAGILVDFSNVPAPKSIAALNSGFVGANLLKMGNLLAARSIKDFGLKKGDQALVMGAFGVPGRSDREDGVVATLQKAGLKVIKLDLKSAGDIAGNPSLLTPLFVANMKKYPKLKYINASGPTLGAMKIYFDAAGIKPGAIKVSGFDLGATVLQSFADGYVQISADQEPFKQGYMPVLSLCMAKVYGLSPSSVDTSSGFVTVDNYKTVAALPVGFR